MILVFQDMYHTENINPEDEEPKDVFMNFYFHNGYLSTIYLPQLNFYMIDPKIYCGVYAHACEHLCGCVNYVVCCHLCRDQRTSFRS